MRDLLLGLDCSTQSFTAVALDAVSLAPVAEAAVNFDRDLPVYGTRGGVLADGPEGEVLAPPLMWVDGLDLVLARLRERVDLGRIRAVAGSAQQHGSVYLRAAAGAALAGLDVARPPARQLIGAFSRTGAPVWLDHSTAADCAALDAALGGPAATAALTGSPACQRFTGPQIRRFARREPAAWADTAQVRLVSSFLASLLLGRLAPSDLGDASGMNLLDLATRTWHGGACAACADDLGDRLGAPVASDAVLGQVAPWLVARHGFAADCRVLAWSGDNPCSATGLGLGADGDAALSLGTSDTLFAYAGARPATPPGGHVFISPDGGHLALLCAANGSLAREAVRDRFRLDWGGFAAALARTPPGNRSRILLPWFRPQEGEPSSAAGVRAVGLAADDADGWCRGVVEGQFLALRRRVTRAGLRLADLRATGGAAANPAILQVAADVFQVPVRRNRVTNTAALGAALRAARADGRPWGDLMAASAPLLDAQVAPTPGSGQALALTAAIFARAAGDG